jgi:hypothetical protein
MEVDSPNIFYSVTMAALVNELSWLPDFVKLTMTVSYSRMRAFHADASFSAMKIPWFDGLTTVSFW